jgi:hypothetical protein
MRPELELLRLDLWLDPGPVILEIGLFRLALPRLGLEFKFIVVEAIVEIAYRGGSILELDSLAFLPNSPFPRKTNDLLDPFSKLRRERLRSVRQKHGKKIWRLATPILVCLAVRRRKILADYADLIFFCVDEVVRFYLVPVRGESVDGHAHFSVALALRGVADIGTIRKRV